MTEEDIRSKIIFQWLKGCGISDADIHIEYAIPLKLGHGERILNSRTDILVRTSAGQNLLIIEVKKPSHALTNDDRDQAISYGRCLAHGGIAPFTILSNGIETKIYDTITGDLLSGNTVPPEHSFVQNGFKVNGDAIAERTEALQYLVGLSNENLLAFCKGQVNYRMDLLKGDTIDSGKKYIPQLYTERHLAQQQLNDKIDGEKKREIILIVGPPQHGKTCFVCASVDYYLSRGIPCLIYPAVGLQGSLLNAIADDFEWQCNESLTHAQVIRRLSKVLEQDGKRLLIFVDGWNEMISHAVSLNSECARLAQSNIQVILSTTSVSIPRLLKDSADNIEYIARKIDVSHPQIAKLATEPLHNTSNTGLVQIGKFNSWELDRAKDLYESLFHVKFSENSNLPVDPFYLRLAAEAYSNGTVPDFATRTSLIRESLVRKAGRRNISTQALFAGLGQLSSIVFAKDAPIAVTDLPSGIFSGNDLNNWLESAILLQTENSFQIPAFDFYYTHDRDYSIALNRGWLSRITSFEEKKRLQEINDAVRTEAGRSALRWFLSCPEYAEELPLLFDLVNADSQTNRPLQKILADAIFNQYIFHGSRDFQWLSGHIRQLLNNDNDEAAEELPELVFSYILSIDKENNFDDYKFWLRILIHSDDAIEDLGFEESFVYKLYEKREVYSYDGYGDDSSFELGMFIDLLYDNNVVVAKRSALCIAGAARYALLEEIPRLEKALAGRTSTELYTIVGHACEIILSSMQSNYYGDMCPGWLTNRYMQEDEEGENDEVYLEFLEQRRLWLPVIKCVSFPEAFVKEIEDVLNDLRKHSGVFAADGSEIKDDQNITVDPNQLKLEL